jgi:hypothetical protein
MIGLASMRVAALVAVQSATVTIPGDGRADPVRLACPVHRTTRVVFPEPLWLVKGLERDNRPLGVNVETMKPQGIIAVTPTSHPSSGVLELRGPTLVVRVLLESTPEGTGSEIRLALAPPPTPEPASTPAPSPTPAPPSPSPAPAASPPAPSPPAGFFGPQDLLRVVTVPIDRREGRPGQLEMVLVDALEGDEWTWLRFRLEDGAEQRLERIWWDEGDVTRFLQEPAGSDLRVVVQLPRGRVTRRSRLNLKLESGPSYRFALQPSTLPGFLRDIFK